MEKDIGNKKTSTYVNINTVNNNNNNNNTNLFVSIFWVYFEDKCHQESIYKIHFWLTLMSS